MSKPKIRKSDTPKYARPKPKHGKRRETGTRKAAPRKVTRSARSASSMSVTAAGKNLRDTKQARVIAMLCAPSGATIEAMMRMTEWQQHSVRGFLAAVVRKKLGLDLQSEASDSGRVYRINARGASPAAGSRAEHAS
jgi:hypothetical protein